MELRDENTVYDYDLQPNPEYKCPLALMMLSDCKQTFQTLREQKIHVKKYHSTPGEKTEGGTRKKSTVIHYCEQCVNETFRTPKELRIHKERNHPYKGQFIYTCKEEGCEHLRYTTKSSLLLHQYRKHREPTFQCSYCSEPPYTMQCDLSQHIRRKHHYDDKFISINN